MRRGTALVVQQDDDTRRRIGSWLGSSGFDVLVCPGPKPPDYTCLAARGAPCPLPAAADLIVLDLRLATDTLMRGTPGWQILLYYLAMDKRVVALVGDEDAVRPLQDEQVRTLRRPVDRAALLGAVDSLLGVPAAARLPLTAQ